MYKDDPAAGEKFVSDALSRLKATSEVNEAVKSADLVVEAIVENIEIKHKLFAAIDAVSIFLTNFNIFYRIEHIRSLSSMISWHCGTRQRS